MCTPCCRRTLTAAGWTGCTALGPVRVGCGADRGGAAPEREATIRANGLGTGRCAPLPAGEHPFQPAERGARRWNPCAWCRQRVPTPREMIRVWGPRTRPVREHPRAPERPALRPDPYLQARDRPDHHGRGPPGHCQDRNRAQAEPARPRGQPVHPRAGSDHPRPQQAGSEHPRVGSAHPRAESEHPRAGSGHPRAESVHPRAGPEASRTSHQRRVPQRRVPESRAPRRRAPRSRRPAAPRPGRRQTRFPPLRAAAHRRALLRRSVGLPLHASLLSTLSSSSLVGTGRRRS
ncbi:hypothetical protein QE397_003831 [Rhodococcus sp. SORGH_AS 301]|nr:hypothetical protein [Rhodococcus sp. SORGH_AS_0301]